MNTPRATSATTAHPAATSSEAAAAAGLFSRACLLYLPSYIYALLHLCFTQEQARRGAELARRRQGVCQRGREGSAWPRASKHWLSQARTATPARKRCRMPHPRPPLPCVPLPAAPSSTSATHASAALPSPDNSARRRAASRRQRVHAARQTRGGRQILHPAVLLPPAPAAPSAPPSQTPPSAATAAPPASAAAGAAALPPGAAAPAPSAAAGGPWPGAAAPPGAARACACCSAASSVDRFSRICTTSSRICDVTCALRARQRRSRAAAAVTIAANYPTDTHARARGSHTRPSATPGSTAPMLPLRAPARAAATPGVHVRIGLG
jgi:hypothetical protein